MKETIKKINELVYSGSKEVEDVNLEMLLIALQLKKDYILKESIFYRTIIVKSNGISFTWQLNLPFSQQSEETKMSINKLFE